MRPRRSMLRRAPTAARTRRRAVGAALIAPLLATPASAEAHGLVGRADLPIPQWLFVWAASVVLVVSFVALATSWTRPLLEKRASLHALARPIGRAVTSPAVQAVCGAVGVGLLALAIYAGFTGAKGADENIAPTLVYVAFWLGLVPLSVLLGDVFALFNPWRAIGRVVARIVRPVGLRAPLRYPSWLGRWPAVAGLLCFAWLELVSTRGDKPATIALAAVVYSGLTWLAMALFGVERWARDGEAFSVYFNLLSRVSIFVRRGRQVQIRAPLSGLTSLKQLPGSVAIVAVMIGSVTFDGFSSGPTWQKVAAGFVEPLRSLGFGAADSLQLVYTLGLGVAVVLVFGFYRVAIGGVARLAGERTPEQLAKAFAHSLVPIALAYAGAHYVSLLLLQGQALGAFASDPFGDGSNLFGTAAWTVDLGWISAELFWYLQVAMVIAGHVGALALAHDRALVLFEDARAAVRSQYWMLAVMIGFTCLALWLLSEASKG